MKKVDFLVTGVARAGTTALFEILRSHPDISMSIEKEPHYFDNENLDWTTPDHTKNYHKYFEDMDSCSLHGEATPIYSYWPLAYSRIKQYNPDIKIILILRDRVSRTFSHWLYNKQIGWENLDFSTSIRSGRNRIESGKVRDKKLFSYVERSIYAPQIERLTSYFQRQQIHICYHTEFIMNPEKFINSICRFLKISEFYQPLMNKKLNQSKKNSDNFITANDRILLTDIFDIDSIATNALLKFIDQN